MSIKYFKKTLYLPSGGESYSPLVYLNKFDYSFIIAKNDVTSFDCHFDAICSIIRHYCELPVPIEQMYTNDIYYIWSMLQMISINIMYVGSYAVCSCGNTIHTEIEYAALDTRVLNEYTKVNLFETLNINELTINLHARKVIDNYKFMQLISTINDPQEIYGIKKIIMFIMTQTEYINIKGKQLDKQQWYNYLSSLSMKEINAIYECCTRINRLFGFYDVYEVKCKHCGQKIRGYIFNDYSYCLPNESVPQPNLEEVYEGLIQEARYPTNTLEDGFHRPLVYGEKFHEALKKIDFQFGQVIA